MEQVITIKTLKELFQRSADVLFEQYNFNQHKVHFITCDSMIDQQLLNSVIVQRLQSLFEDISAELQEDNILKDLHIPNLQKVKTKEDAITLVYTGHVLLYFEKENFLFSSNIADKPNRKPEETRLELIVKGPRDDFIEDVFINIALIRKRIPTNSLSVETMEIGKRSKTTVAVLYFEDIANKNMLGIIKKSIKPSGYRCCV